MYSPSSRSGFTLTEIAVVMTITGLLAAGAVAGHKMIRNADVASTVMQVKAVETATMKFYDYYKNLPGDMPDADTRIKNCNQACKNTAPDAGDGKIGSPTWDMSTFQSASLSNTPNTTDAGETVTFWYELANADMGISGITADGVTGKPSTFGGSLPKANLGGGFMVGFSDGTQAGAAQGRPAAAGPVSITGTVLALSAIPATLNANPGVQIMTPVEAAQLDRKMDDGLPDKGNVQAYGVSASCYGAAAPFSYNEKSSGKDCGLYFRVGNPPVNGSCGGANGHAAGSAPAAGLCRTGVATVVAGGTTSPWTWTCNGTNGGTNADCSAPVNGSCGTANGAGTTTAPSTNLCIGGALDTVAGSGPWTWNCNGTTGGSNAACGAPLNGSCGAANNVGSATTPAANLCNTGTSTAVAGGGSTQWSWACNGSPGGASDNCTAPVNGTCGASNGAALPSAPTSLCNSGTASAVSGAGPWTWSCDGTTGGANAACGATLQLAVNGVCGSDNGQTLSSAPTNLCSAGGPSGVSGSGPWNWSCSGTNGGSTASCSAQSAGYGGKCVRGMVGYSCISPTSGHVCAYSLAGAFWLEDTGCDFRHDNSCMVGGALFTTSSAGAQSGALFAPWYGGAPPGAFPSNCP